MYSICKVREKFKKPNFRSVLKLFFDPEIFQYFLFLWPLFKSGISKTTESKKHLPRAVLTIMHNSHSSLQSTTPELASAGF